MKIIYNKVLPVKGFRAITLFGVVFARKDQPVPDQRVLRHESIHTRQMLELAVVGFYAWYVVEWLVKWAVYKNRHTAYRNICFEREAFDNDKDADFLKHRPFWNFTNYL